MTLLLRLLLSSPLLGLPIVSTVEDEIDPVWVGDYEALAAEYAEAEQSYRRELRRADRETRKLMRKNPPARVFYDRFEALAEEGDGQALLWTLIQINMKGLGVRATREARKQGYARLVTRHVKAPWFNQVLDRLPRERRNLGAEELMRIYESASAENPSREVQAQALYLLYLELRRTEEPAHLKRADELLKRVIDEYGDTDFASKADSDLFIAMRLSVGREAPDFNGKTIDGYEFKLSDYRGKIVLVDFYGFW